MRDEVCSNISKMPNSVNEWTAVKNKENKKSLHNRNSTCKTNLDTREHTHTQKIHIKEHSLHIQRRKNTHKGTFTPHTKNLHKETFIPHKKKKKINPPTRLASPYQQETAAPVCPPIPWSPLWSGASWAASSPSSLWSSSSTSSSSCFNAAAGRNARGKGNWEDPHAVLRTWPWTTRTLEGTMVWCLVQRRLLD